MVLRAELPLIVTVVAVPHRLDPRPEYVAGPVRITAWRGEPAGPDDPLRTASPEAHRAYENTDEEMRALTTVTEDQTDERDRAPHGARRGRGRPVAVDASPSPPVDHLRIVDLEGNQAVDCLLYVADDPVERYSAPDTIAAQGNIFLTTGTVLMCNEGRPMMTIVEPTPAAGTTRSAAPAPASRTRSATGTTRSTSTPASRTSCSSARRPRPGQARHASATSTGS